MQSFSEVHKVVPEDLDEREHVNNIRYVQWIQDISKKHWNLAVHRELRESMVWVVRSHHITYYRAAVLGDRIRISTHVEGFKGPLSYRTVEMAHALTGELLVHARTQWCLLDATSLRPKRTPEAIIALFAKPEK